MRLNELTRALTRPRGPVRRNRRSGVALLVVMTTIMILTVVITELSYTARVRFLVAAHEKERAQAYWLSQTGINVYKLLLSANKQMEGNSMMSQGASMLGINLGDALWQMVPVFNTGLLRMLFASGGDASDIEEEEVEAFKQTGKVSEETEKVSREGGLFNDKNFLDFEGDFNAEIVDEDSKLNVSLLGNAQQKSVQDSAIGQQLYGLMSGEEHDQWFRDKNIDRWEIIANLKDWVDKDSMRSGRSGGYEDALYNNLESPYLAKNAPFDTFDEIRLVDGWQDDIMDRFGKQLTIHGVGKVNVNTADDEVVTALIKAYVQPAPNDAECFRIMEQMREYQLFASFKDGKDFAEWLQNQGHTVSEELKDQLGESSKTFRITSTGMVGNTMVTTTAIVDYTQSNEGSVVYWRVD
jgi:type II secretory pathway component PulK